MLKNVGNQTVSVPNDFYCMDKKTTIMDVNGNQICLHSSKYFFFSALQKKEILTS